MLSMLSTSHRKACAIEARYTIVVEIKELKTFCLKFFAITWNYMVLVITLDFTWFSLISLGIAWFLLMTLDLMLLGLDVLGTAGECLVFIDYARFCLGFLPIDRICLVFIDQGVDYDWGDKGS